MANYIYGLKAILIGPIESDGGMSLTLAEKFGDTKLGTARVTTENGTTTAIYVEEKTDPVVSSTQEGKMTVTWETHNCSPQSLVEAFGGTITGDGTTTPFRWNAPAANVQPERSIRFETPDKVYVEFPRVKLNSQMNIVFDKTQLGSVTITGDVLAPTKAGTSKMRVGTFV